MSLVSLAQRSIQTKSAFNHHGTLTVQQFQWACLSLDSTNYCVPEVSREVVLSLQTTLLHADTESDRCWGKKVGWLVRLLHDITSMAGTLYSPFGLIGHDHITTIDYIQ